MKKIFALGTSVPVLASPRKEWPLKRPVVAQQAQLQLRLEDAKLVPPLWIPSGLLPDQAGHVGERLVVQEALLVRQRDVGVFLGNLWEAEQALGPLQTNRIDERGETLRSCVYVVGEGRHDVVPERSSILKLTDAQERDQRPYVFQVVLDGGPCKTPPEVGRYAARSLEECGFSSTDHVCWHL